MTIENPRDRAERLVYHEDYDTRKLAEAFIRLDDAYLELVREHNETLIFTIDGYRQMERAMTHMLKGIKEHEDEVT